MPRMPRIQITGALYYITSRGDHNGDIFRDEEDYSFYMELLGRYKKQYGFKLFSFVLLSNHLHLLIELPEGGTLSGIMHDLNSNYTKFFNRKYSRQGHLFQERYRVVLLEKELKLLAMTAYMHKNPHVAGVSSGLDYQYSSSPLYIKAETRSSIKYPDMTEEIAQVNLLLSPKSYAEFLNGLAESGLRSLGEELKKSIIGSDAFIERARSQLQQQGDAVSAAQSTARKATRLIHSGVLALALLTLAAFLLAGMNWQLKKRFRNVEHEQDIIYSNKLNEQMKFIKKDLDEKYRADLVSYQAMQKRLEIEKKKVKDLITKKEESK